MKSRLDKLKSKLNFDEEKFKLKARELKEDISEKTIDAVDFLESKTKEIYDNREEIISTAKEKTKEFTTEVSKQSKLIGKTVVSKTKETKSSIKSTDLFNSKIRQKSIDDYNQLVEKYEETAEEFGDESQKLYEIREEALYLIKNVEKHINSLANKPKNFEVKLQKIKLEVQNFESKKKEIIQAEKEARIAAAGSGTGASLSALGLTVATMGPTAAMGIATTFGAASTGAAISSLSGAAASNAALAWLGGGALAAGGGGMSAGTAFLALAGPVGWTLAGVALTASVGTGLFASSKNKELAEKLIEERKSLEVANRRLQVKTFEMDSLKKVTDTQITGLEIIDSQVIKKNYLDFNEQEKLQAGVLVNSTLALSELVNKELRLDE